MSITGIYTPPNTDMLSNNNATTHSIYNHKLTNASYHISYTYITNTTNIDDMCDRTTMT